LAEPDSKQADRQQTGRQRTKRTGRQPISRHPLFPAIVALWFATLIGVGSLALSTSLIENLVLASHIDSLIPAATPPLGATARLMLAVMVGVPGGVMGWILAKRLGSPKQAAGPQVFKVTDADLGAQWPGVAEAPTRAEPAAIEPAPLLDPSSLTHDVEKEAPLPAAEMAVEQEVIPAPSAHTAAQRIAAASLADLSHVELVERLAIALQRREELLGTAPDETAETANPVLHFPDFADRRNARLALPTAQSRPVPQETEKALRAALAQLERMSGTA
jgi:hypothetical protein